jgi:hypothetical protein
MSPTKLAVAEAKINRRSEAARKGGDLAGMQQAMAELTALYRACRRGTEALVRGRQRGVEVRPNFHWDPMRGLLMPPIRVTRTYEIRLAKPLHRP